MAVKVSPNPARHPKIAELNKELRALNDQSRKLNDAIYDIANRHARAWWDQVTREFVLTSDHVNLLKHMRFALIEDTDLVSVGADGKLPFGNGDWVDDVYDILGWTATFDREGMDEASIDRALRIVAELPLALNAIIKQLDISEG